VEIDEDYVEPDETDTQCDSSVFEKSASSVFEKIENPVFNKLAQDHSPELTPRGGNKRVRWDDTESCDSFI
jgi:hypothetical protein